ncbi:short-chain dehydrogenase [Enterococcus saigonensis]|uniref:Short-chain dehydrogenase n=1 Tax=Enterococcus saigonensis TaxID=1805431 RepID=A0A679IJG3_9ENTE|nr:SDR family oxidoreductase [Enterococcus saigonensis]BCA86262.1 short-chain dehydrogenase [Enterococcus saigonensis]
MKVLVVGANGKVAKHFANQIEKHPFIQEKAVIRNEAQTPFFNARGIETVLLDIVTNSIEEFAAAMQDVDAIVFSAGAGGKGLDKTIMIDLDGAIKIMTAAEISGIKRFIMVSTFKTGRKEITREIKENSSLTVYTIAKNYADEWLKHRTNLDWTIIHPGALTNDAGTGKIKLADNLTGELEKNTIPREDVATVILATLENDATIGKEFEIISGDTSVALAIGSFK